MCAHIHTRIHTPDAIELTVSLPSWDGENQLRPWAVAWRTFCERSSKVEDVLSGVLKRLMQLQGDLRDAK